MIYDRNPFPEGDADRHFLWEMLVRRERGLVTSRVLAGTIRRTGDDHRDERLCCLPPPSPSR
jgi:hypothetical protein